jgi:phosphoglycolate phosphatase
VGDADFVRSVHGILRGLSRLIVFDLDGTLVDSRRDLAESANTLLAEYGCAALPEDAVGRMVGDGAAVLVTRAFAAAGSVPPSEALTRFLAIYNSRLLTFTRTYPGIHDALAALGARALLAVLTNKPRYATCEILDALDLARHFPPARVVGGDGPFPRKPDPAGLHHLIREAAATPDDTMMVGDSVIDWRTARAAGTHICLARYGFGFEGFPIGDLSPDDRLVDHADQLVAVL